MENAVYNKEVGAWMIPQNDPYTLENFQAAYDNLASGKSCKILTRAEAIEFPESKQLEPTHYALRIYPKTEEEQWRVETMEDVSVVYAPFNYAVLTSEEITRVPKTRVQIHSPFEVSPYTVTYDYTGSTDGDPTGPETLQLPVLYSVWPVDKPLPDDLEYKKDYDIFLPEAADQVMSGKAISLLRSEMWASVSTRANNDYTGPVWSFVSGTIKTYDSSLGKNVPMVNLQLKLIEGSSIKTYTTDANGYFSFEAATTGPDFWYPMPLRIVYQDPQRRWKITAAESNTTIPYEDTGSIPLLDVYHRPTPLNIGDVILPTDPRRAEDIQRAANYFYCNQTDFTKHYPIGGVRIKAYSSYGRGSYSFGGPITLYNRGNDGQMIGDTLHEIGHLVHYNNCPARYTNSPKIIRESFACYVAWYVGENYYQTNGWAENIPQDITHYNRQDDWTKFLPNDSGWYSPLFIDLTDSYNQRGFHGSEYPHDYMIGVSASKVWSIIATNPDWDTSFKEKLWSYCRINRPRVDFDDYMHDFDEWVRNNSPLVY